MAKESENGEERTEDPTSKRIQDAREKGQVSKSQEVSTAFLFAGSVLAFYFYIPSVARDIASMTGIFLENTSRWDGTSEGMMDILLTTALFLGKMLLPIFLVFMVIGFASNFMQIGMIFSTEPMTPKLSKINPVTGFKNKFLSIRTLEMFIKNILILILIGWVAYQAVKREIPIFPPLINADPGVIVLTIFKSSMRLIWDALWVFIIIAVVDFSFQRWQHKKDLMMTKQEIKEEFKQTEGNPQIKSRIRSIQLQMARRRMMQAVPKADVIITNPIHLAIALKYERGAMAAPVVVAKGAGPLAEKIKETARKSSVPIVENKPLARALYKTVELGDFIPEELYKAVAEILAYVYKLKAGAA